MSESNKNFHKLSESLDQSVNRLTSLANMCRRSTNDSDSPDVLHHFVTQVDLEIEALFELKRLANKTFARGAGSDDPELPIALDAITPEKSATGSQLTKTLQEITAMLEKLPLGEFGKVEQTSAGKTMNELIDAANTASSNIQLHMTRHEFVLDGAGLGTWDWWLESNLVSFDRRWCAMLGLSHEDTPQELSTWDVRVHPDDKAQAFADIQAYLDGKSAIYENIHRMRHSNGSWIWILDRGRISEWDANGKPIRFSGTHLDITQYKESEAITNNIQQMAMIGGWELEVATMKTCWTAETYRIHAIAPEIPTDKITGIKFYSADDQSRIAECIAGCIAGQAYRETFSFVDSNGVHKWVEVMGEPIRDANGKVTKLRGTFQDVSTQVQQSLALENLIISLDDLVFEIDENNRFTNVWAQDENKLFMPKAAFINRSYLEVLPPKLSELLTQAITKAKDLATPFSFDYSLPSGTEDGKTVWYRGKIVRQQSNKHIYTLVIADITVEKQARLAEDIATKELHQFFNVALEMLCIAGADGIFRKLNPAWSEILGYTEQELISKPFIEFVHPDDVSKTIKEIEKLSQGIPTIHFENRYRTKDGSYRILSWVTRPDPENGSLYAAARDITEARLKEAELRQVKEAIDRSAIVCITDDKGNILEANENFCKISGYGNDQLVGQNRWIVSSGADSKDFYHGLQCCIASGHIWVGELENQAQNGSQYIVQTVIAPLVSPDAKIDRYLAISFDVTDRRESERQLSEAQRVAKIGSWSFNLASQKISWSNQMYQIFPESPENGPPSFERHYSTIHPEDQQHWRQIVERCFRDGEPYKIRFRSVFPDGSVKWLEAHGEAKLDLLGNVRSLHGTCQDIEELVKTEESLRMERAKAVHSAKLASLGEMSAGIAHEINNPLMIIAGITQSLPKHAGDPEKIRSKLATIEKATVRITKIVTGLRKFSRTSVSNKFKQHNLKKIIEEATILTGAKARRHLIDVKIECEENAFIDCDEIEIEQVLVNLINNAIDALAESADRWIKLKQFYAEDDIVLQIWDSGKGIPMDIRDKLFQPFFTTKPVGQGTGLGLAITKGILDEHQASITLLTEENNTCFEIRF